LDSQNNTHGKIHIRLSIANMCYSALANLFKSKLISKNTKGQLHISYMRPVLTNAYATWVTTKSDKKKLKKFKRKILRNIHGPI